jgi:hypothetical protein
VTALDDPFALPEVAKVTTRDSVLSRGRYMLPTLQGGKKSRGYMRVSNLVSAYSDQFGLRMWELGEVLKGVAYSPHLYAALLEAFGQEMDKDERRAWVEEFIEHAKEASGGNAAAKHGTARHEMVEAHHLGLPQQHLAADARRHLALYDSALTRNRLAALPGMQERRVLVEELEVVGTLDNVLEDTTTGHLFIGDLKTQRRFWSWLEVAAQLACYAHGVAMWDPVGECWTNMPPVSQEVALILWMPRETENGEPRVDVYEVDIVAGWRTAQNAYKVVQDRAAAKSVRNPRARLRAAPVATEIEKMAARFAACDSLAEGRKLVSESMAAGIWGPILAECAQKARDRIAFPA